MQEELVILSALTGGGSVSPRLAALSGTAGSRVRHLLMAYTLTSHHALDKEIGCRSGLGDEIEFLAQPGRLYGALVARLLGQEGELFSRITICLPPVAEAEVLPGWLCVRERLVDCEQWGSGRAAHTPDGATGPGVPICPRRAAVSIPR